MNDNQNYFVTRSTSRVLSIPGGKCSIDIFGDDTNGAPAPTAKLTVVDANSTINIAPAEAKLSHTAPSNATSSSASTNEAFKNKQRAMGESFDLFGCDEPVAKEKKPAGNNSTAAPSTQKVEEQAHKPAGSADKPISSNQFASSATTNSYNVITARPTSRVLAEPGGKSRDDLIFG
jgi:hypothetical protein